MSQHTLGRMIGRIKHNLSITNDAKEKVQLGITIDFSTATDLDIKGWAVSNRVIAGQRPWRSLSEDELLDLDGQTIMAVDIGRKVKSRQERIASYTSMGLPLNLAETAVDSPDRFQNLIKSIDEIDTMNVIEESR